MSNEAHDLHSAARSGSENLSEIDLIRFCSEIFSGGPMHERFINEARFGLSRLLPILPSSGLGDLDVLEVGAGTCLLSAYLASKKLRVTALEPLGPEFDFFTDLQGRVLDFCRRNEIVLRLIRKTGEQLDASNKFDVTFTINALEHMREPLLVVDNMYLSLKSGGILLVHCPNYTVPLEVHFNILLVTRSKRLNAWLYRSRIKRYPRVWNELNFIRYIDLQRHLARRGFSFKFNRLITRDLVLRLFNDQIFAQRMPLPIRAVGRVMKKFGLVNRLNLIPARFQTPMEVLIRKS
jgi:SAM-dependent methyltransferase